MPAGTEYTITISIHTLAGGSIVGRGSFVSIRTLLTEGDIVHGLMEVDGIISIHAPSREATCSRSSAWASPAHFYPHPSHGGRRRRRTGLGSHTPDFYPRSPCGERRHELPLGPRRAAISIHALLAEGDPRLSHSLAQPACISIHAPFAEGGSDTAHKPTAARHFYSHALHLEQRPTG